MRRALVLLAVILPLYGCATPERCADRQFFKAFVDGKPNPNRYFPGVAELRLHEDVTLRVSICKREAADALCVEIYPTEGVAFQFLEPRVTVHHNAANSSAELPFKKITYNVACHGPTLAEKDADCESSTASPLVGNADVHKSRVRASKIGANFYYLDAYEFAPDATFKGAMVSATFLTKFRRKYEAITQPFQPSPSDELVVAIPNVRIGSQTLDVPQSSFKYVTENVCLPNRPLSLQ
jgi:hypothetical protein